MVTTSHGKIEIKRAAIFVVVLAAALGLFFNRRIPTELPGAPAIVAGDKKLPTY